LKKLSEFYWFPFNDIARDQKILPLLFVLPNIVVAFVGKLLKSTTIVRFFLEKFDKNWVNQTSLNIMNLAKLDYGLWGG